MRKLAIAAFVVIGLVSPAGAQSYPPYPYNLGGGGAYDRGYTSGYTRGTDTYTDPTSEYGRGNRAGNTDYWIDMERRSADEARRRQEQIDRLRDQER